MSEWISVEDRLPEEMQYVAIVVESDYGLDRGYGCREVVDEVESWRIGVPFISWDYDFNSSEYLSVTHWMPLPEAPKTS